MHLTASARSDWSRVAAAYPRSTSLEPSLDRLLAAGGSMETIGHSHGGRPIRAYSWRNAAGAGSDPSTPGLLLLSLLHPLEWIGLEAHLALLEGWILGKPPASELRAGTPADVAARLGAAPRADLTTGLPADLPADLPIYSIPVANPDGLARVEAALRSGRTCRARGNDRGIDLNRNFPVGFRRRPRGLDSWPLYRPGPFPLSEPESAAIATFASRHPLRLALSLHSLGRWIFYPPAHARLRDACAQRHARAVEQAKIAERGGRRGGTGPYRVGQLGRWSPFFRARGTEIDLLAGADGFAFLVEISGGGFGQWGWRRSLQPFFLFNPAKPERELAVLLPLLHRLARRCAAGSMPPGRP